MRKNFSILITLLFTTTCGSNIIACNSNSKVNLKSVIKNPNLGLIAEENNTLKPTVKDLKKAIAKNYANININDINIFDKYITSDSAIIIGTDMYVGKISVNFKTDKSVPLDSVITNPDLGTVYTEGQALPSKELIIKTLQDKFTNLQSTIDITNITATSATVSTTNQTIYTGQVNLTFKTDKSVPLDSVITNPDLGNFYTKGQPVPSKEAIIKTLHDKFTNLQSTIDVTNITATSATVSTTNQTIYTGQVNLTFKTDKSVPLDSVITNPDLGTFYTKGQPVPSKELITKTLHDKFTNLQSTIDVTNITATSATVISTDQTIYTGQVNLTFKTDKSVPLDSVITAKNLQTINTNGLQLPTVALIKNSIKQYNSKLTNLDYITVDNSSITATSAVIRGDDINYKGQLTVNFTVDSSSITLDFTYNEAKDFPALTANGTFEGHNATLLSNWTNYAKSWDEFIKLFPKLSFGNNSVMSIFCNGYINQQYNGTDIKIDTSNITNDPNNLNICNLNGYYDGGFFGTYVTMNNDLKIWHDANNIYFSIHWNHSTGKTCTRDPIFNDSFQGATFHK